MTLASYSRQTRLAPVSRPPPERLVPRTNELAPGITCNAFTQFMRAKARRFNSRTSGSLPPTIASVGACTRAGERLRQDRAGLRATPPRGSGEEAPPRPLTPHPRRCSRRNNRSSDRATWGCSRSHCVIATRRFAKNGMSKRSCPVCRSTSCSSAVSKSMSSVAERAFVENIGDVAVAGAVARAAAAVCEHDNARGRGRQPSTRPPRSAARTLHRESMPAMRSAIQGSLRTSSSLVCEKSSYHMLTA